MVLERNNSSSNPSSPTNRGGKKFGPAPSLAGTWGEEIRKKSAAFSSSSGNNAEVEERFTTVAHASFTNEPFIKVKEVDPNKYSKFVRQLSSPSFFPPFLILPYSFQEHLRKNGAVIVNQAAYERLNSAAGGEGGGDGIEGEFLDQAMTPFTNSGSGPSFSRTVSRASSRGNTASRGGHRPETRDENRLSTTFRESYKSFSPCNDSFQFDSSVDMRATNYKMVP